jgi:hypothetical protein
MKREDAISESWKRKPRRLDEIARPPVEQALACNGDFSPRFRVFEKARG